MTNSDYITKVGKPITFRSELPQMKKKKAEVKENDGKLSFVCSCGCWLILAFSGRSAVLL